MLVRTCNQARLVVPWSSHVFARCSSAATPKNQKGAPLPQVTLPSLPLPANPTKHCFIPLCGYDTKIANLFIGGKYVFIRAGVATGKSTLAAYLASTYPRRFILVQHADGSEQEWRRSIVHAIQQACPNEFMGNTSLPHALAVAAKQGFTLIFDEAHTLFACNTLCMLLFKGDAESKPQILLISAAGEGRYPSGEAAATPSEITNKYMWTPPMPTAKEIQACSVQKVELVGII